MACRAVAGGVVVAAAVRTGNDDGAKALASLRANDTNETEANATRAGRFMLEMMDMPVSISWTIWVSANDANAEQCVCGDESNEAMQRRNGTWRTWLASEHVARI